MTLHKLDEGRTKVMVQMDQPEGLKESVGSAVGMDSRRVKRRHASGSGVLIESRASDRWLARGRRELAVHVARTPR